MNFGFTRTTRKSFSSNQPEGDRQQQAAVQFQHDFEMQKTGIEWYYWIQENIKLLIFGA